VEVHAVDGKSSAGTGLDQFFNKNFRLVILKRIFQHLPSEGGKQFFERLLTTGATARIRGVPFFDWLIKALHAYHQGLPLPALEPT
jgi:hypothetical protein